MVGKPAEGKPRSERIVLRVLTDERARWTRAAEKSGITLSAWIRTLANEAAPKKRKKPGEHKP
jgi:hypothetical protein